MIGFKERRARQEIFTRRLREAMINANMPQGVLAKETGIPPLTIHNYMHAKSVPRQEAYLEKVANALGVTPEWLFAESEELQ